MNGLIVGCIYAPNGNPQPGPKFDYKMKWLSRFARHAAKLRRQDHPTIIAGDYNVAPTDLDIYPTKSWVKDALVQPEPRKAFKKLVESGWTDTIRELYGDERVYTFWTYWRNRYERNDGLRLDHLLVSKALKSKLVAGGVDADSRGEDGASDHAPAWVELK